MSTDQLVVSPPLKDLSWVSFFQRGTDIIIHTVLQDSVPEDGAVDMEEEVLTRWCRERRPYNY